MKICVLGLDCAAPEVIFGDERLVNLRRLMDVGVDGRLESVVPPITVPAWMCMCTSQDPGSLGVYGFRNRSDHSYDKLGFANSASIKALAIWDKLATIDAHKQWSKNLEPYVVSGTSRWEIFRVI